ncbi:hypothetical protein RhiirC2_718628 [Rhizophagus irregularis]|uniref:Potassium channel tetramerisation-type BTB domain-containing protein n=1 Tax=Rhizophagus irregularis TaxID=588596 RepID=A0A2N1MHN0_9GLOM|nr:hypothetical protein RhiirC2_718628 [Rhizophagus irregularis]
MDASFNLYMLSSNGPEVYAVNIYKDDKNKDGYVKIDLNTNISLDLLKVLHLRNYIRKEVDIHDINKLKLWKLEGFKLIDIKEQNISTEKEIVQKLHGKEMELDEPFSTYFQNELNDKNKSGSSIITIIPATGITIAKRKMNDLDSDEENIAKKEKPDSHLKMSSSTAITCQGCGKDTMSVYFSGNLENVFQEDIERWLSLQPYAFTHVMKNSSKSYGMVHFNTIKDASVFFYGMSSKVHNGPLINNVIKFSEAFKFGTKEKVIYPKIMNELIIDLTNVDEEITKKDNDKRRKMENDNKITLNIGGIKYETFQSTLTAHPDTLLGRLNASDCTFAHKLRISIYYTCNNFEKDTNHTYSISLLLNFEIDNAENLSVVSMTLPYYYLHFMPLNNL